MTAPRSIAGIGFRGAATATSLIDALRRAGADQACPLGVPATKADHPAVLSLAKFGYSILPLTRDELAAAPTLTNSPASHAAHGTGSVAEACAIAAARRIFGRHARLAGPRSISGDGMATAAVAHQGDPA